jgi:drug/metabolite transporter (DMT)-like permease
MIALAAVLAVSPDAMLLRLIRHNAPDEPGAGALQVISLLLSIKYLMMGTIQLTFVVWSSDGVGTVAKRACRSWRVLIGPSACMLVTQLGFTVGLLETTAANAIMLFSLNPLWAAVLGLLFLKDKVRRHTWIAMAIAGCAVALAFVPTVLKELMSASGSHAAADAFTVNFAQKLPQVPRGGDEEGASHSTLHGNLIAFTTGVTLAAFITSSRAGSLSDPNAPMGVAPALGSLGAAMIATPIAIMSWHTLPLATICDPWFLLFIFVDAVLEAFYDLWMGMAAEYITSCEVALVLLLEIPLGPLLVFFTFGERPGLYTIVGCSVLVVTLVGHGIVEARTAESRRESKRSSLAASPISSQKGTPAASSASFTANGHMPSPSNLSFGAVRRTFSWSEDLAVG